MNGEREEPPAGTPEWDAYWQERMGVSAQEWNRIRRAALIAEGIDPGPEPLPEPEPDPVVELAAAAEGVLQRWSPTSRERLARALKEWQRVNPGTA